MFFFKGAAWSSISIFFNWKILGGKLENFRKSENICMKANLKIWKKIKIVKNYCLLVWLYWTLESNDGSSLFIVYGILPLAQEVGIGNTHLPGLSEKNLRHYFDLHVCLSIRCCNKFFFLPNQQMLICNKITLGSLPNSQGRPAA